MKRLSFLWVSVLGSLLLLIPQTANAGWMRTYGGDSSEVGRCVLPVLDSFYMIVGSTSSFSGGVEVWLLNVAYNGDTIWTRTYEGVGGFIDSTLDSGYIITGVRNEDLLLLKTDLDGNVLWSRTYGGDEYDGGQCVSATSDGGYIVTGVTRSLDTAGYPAPDLWLLKTDFQGNEEWSLILGGENFDWGSCVRETSDGGYIVCGTRDAINGFAQGLIWWFKTDSSGNILWEHTYKDGDRIWGNCIQETSEGDYIIVGGMDEHGGFEASLLLLKTDSLGNTDWVKKYGTFFFVDGCWVEQTSDGGYIATGYCSSEGGNTPTNLWLLKMDTEGDTLWTRHYGGEDTEIGRCVKQTADGGYIVTGVTYNSIGYPDLYLIKTDSLGYVFVEEEMAPEPATTWVVLTSIGPRIVLLSSDMPDGFHAPIFDATGRKVDEIHSTNASGTITWGEGVPRGVYFIRVSNGLEGSKTSRVIIIH